MQQRGQHRTSNELRKQRVFISGSGVRSVWFRHNLENFKKRLKALERRASDDEACGEIETAHPGTGHILCWQPERRWAYLPADILGQTVCSVLFDDRMSEDDGCRQTDDVCPAAQYPVRGRDDAVRSAARWPLVYATLCPAPDRYRSRVISPLIIPFLSKITLSVV